MLWPFLHQLSLQCSIQGHWPWWRNQGGTWGSPRQEIYWTFDYLMQKANQKLTGMGIFPVMCWPSTGARAGMLVLCCVILSKRIVIILKSIQSKVWPTDEFCTLGRSSCVSEKTCLGSFSNAFSISRVACWLGENWGSRIWCLLCRVSAAPCFGVAVGVRRLSLYPTLCFAGNSSDQGGGDLGPLQAGGLL